MGAVQAPPDPAREFVAVKTGYYHAFIVEHGGEADLGVFLVLQIGSHLIVLLFGDNID